MTGAGPNPEELEHPSGTKPLGPGSRVECCVCGGEKTPAWKRGVVAADHGDDTYDVKYDDDGTVESKVARKSVWVLKTPSVGNKDTMPLYDGMRVQARQNYEKPWKGGVYACGSAPGDRAQITYDDGSVEAVERWRIRPHPEL
jgi:hypothetical protein